jgi:hypothetical protein
VRAVLFAGGGYYRGICGAIKIPPKGVTWPNDPVKRRSG